MAQPKRSALIAAVVLLAVAAVATAQQPADLTRFKSQVSFTNADEGRIAQMLENDKNTVLTGRDDAAVTAARKRLVDQMEDNSATPQFRETVARLVVTQFGTRLNQALAQRNRLAVTIVVARAQIPEALQVLLKLIGQGQQGEIYPSVRYWAAKGLAAKPMIEIIRSETPVRMPTVVNWIADAIEREKDPIVARALFEALGGIQTQAATDALIKTVPDKARAFDLSGRDAVDAMKTAVDGLRTAYGLEIRPAAEGKQPILTAMVQVLVQTPPYGDALDLSTHLDGILAELTGIKTDLAAAISDLEKAGSPRPQQVDLVWIQQLNWMEKLLTAENKDIRLMSRLQTLDWTPERSTEAVQEKSK